MRGLFDINNPVMRFLTKLFDCLVLSVLWIVFSLPIVTMGASSTALYATVYHRIRRDEGYLWQTFWKSFRENFKRSTLSWLAVLAMILFLIYDAAALRAMIRSGHPMGRLYGVILVLLGVAGVWAMYLAAYSARFQGGVKDMIRFSFYLMMAHPIKSIAVLLTLLGVGFIILMMPGLALFLPAAGFWVFSAIVEPIFLQHMRPEDVERTSREKEKMT